MEAVGFGVAKALTTETEKHGVGWLAKQVNYTVNPREMVDKMKNAVSVLSDHKADIERRIENAHGDDKEVTHRTKSWLSEMTKLETKANQIVNDCGENVGILDVAKCHRLGRKSDKLMAEVDELKKEWSTLTIFHPSVVPTFSARPQKEFTDYISVRGVMDAVVDALKNEKNCILGIYGMGGIGKTTLIDQIGRRMEAEKVFDVVIIVEMSQSQDVAEIQDCIAEQLGKNFKANSVEQKSGELASALKRVKNILIMLDNLWTMVDLRKIGIPFADDHKGCKILLTTRKIEVCNQMITDAQFSVNLLSEIDAWHLFKTKAGEVVILTEIECIAKEVARECACLPLAIVVVGLALRGKNERDTWDNALRQLRDSNPRDLVNVEEKLFKCLELSYNLLERDDEKLLFLLCSMFPESYELSEDELTKFRIGEDIFGRFNNLEEARGNMHMLVLKLVDSCLLVRSKKIKVTKMHDVVRDVGIYIASRHDNRFFVKCGSGTNESLDLAEVFKQSKRISLINSGISELPNNPMANELNILLVRNNRNLVNLPDNFFKNMVALTVLDLSNSIIVSLPSSLQYLKNIRVFSLNRCAQLHSISIIGKLENLQALSWQSCPMKLLPKEIGKLTKLKLLDLSHSPDLKLQSKVFSNLRFLEELYSDSKYVDQNALIEIANLKTLSCLQLYIKEVDIFSEDMSSANSLKNLRSYVLYTNPLWIKKTRVYRKNLHIKGAEWLAVWVKLLLREVEELSLNNCFWNAAPLLEFCRLETLTGFSKLKILHISNCQRIAYLIRSVENSCIKDAFVKLEELYLTNLDNLNGISDGLLSELSFGNTRKVQIVVCKSMFSVMPYSLLIRIHLKLEEFRVRDCEELRGVFYFQSYETNIIMFDSLKALYLHDLPKLNDIWSGLIPKGSFGNLKDLHIQGCNELKYLFLASVIPGFRSLEKLIVSHNYNTEEIIFYDGFTLDENVFPRLMELTLVRVPKLKHFYKVVKDTRVFFWPLLKNLKLGVCGNLEILPIGSNSAPQLKMIELEEQRDKDWYKGLRWDDQNTSSRFETFVSEHGSK